MLGEDDAWGDEVEDEEEVTAPRKSEDDEGNLLPTERYARKTCRTKA